MLSAIVCDADHNHAVNTRSMEEFADSVQMVMFTATCSHLFDGLIVPQPLYRI